MGAGYLLGSRICIIHLVGGFWSLVSSRVSFCMCDENYICTSRFVSVLRVIRASKRGISMQHQNRLRLLLVYAENTVAVKQSEREIHTNEE